MIPVLIPTGLVLFAAVGYWLAVIHRTSDDPVLTRDPLTQPVLARVDLRRDTHPGRPA